MSKAMRQKPAQAGCPAAQGGEAAGSRRRDEARGPHPDTRGAGLRPPAAATGSLLEAALARENLQLAWKRVRANKGAAGVDGLDIGQTHDWLRTHWPEVRDALLQGRYRPQPVRRVMIPKADGSRRELGIPTVLDRLIQQALLQVLQPILDPTFSDHSHGFRPGRRAHDAVRQARAYVQSGRRVVVDVDLEKFFDRVNHDILMDRLGRRVQDAAVLRLVRAYLDAGIMAGGVVIERHEGTPQGGPLSPLLANVLLDEVDRELERRGHCFVRYADDCNVYVGSRKAGERVMALLKRLYGRLKLRINEAKSAVASALDRERKFLGFAFYAVAGDEVRCKVAAKPLQTFKHQVRRLTRRTRGRSMEQVIADLRPYLLGWKGYFRLAQAARAWQELDEWLRHRLRALQLKHWRRGTTIYRELRALGASEATARRVAANSRRWWRNSAGEINRVLTIAHFDRLGLPRLS